MRVSVCVPARDAAPYLGAALASALSQDIDGLEVVVVDDGSTDATAELLAGVDDSRLVWRRIEAAGVAAARTACLALARGEYVAFLDADDVLAPGSVAARIALLDAEPEVALVHGAHAVIDEDGRALGGWGAPFAADTIEADAFGQLVCANEVATTTAMARRAAFPGFDGRGGASSSDWDAWLRLALRGPVAYLARPLASYRQHERTISRATVPGGERLRCDVRVAARALRAAAGRPDAPLLRRRATAALAAKALLHAGDAYTRGERGAAGAAVRAAARLAPWDGWGRLAAATARADDVACERLTKAGLAALAGRLDGTRFGARVAALAAPDPAWSAELTHAGRAAAAHTPPGAILAAIAKWDPALLAASGRGGCNLPDRALLPGGYPRDGTEAVAHLEALRRERGVTHVVVPAVSGWWLERYPELARRLGAPGYEDGRCAIFAVGPA
ncbi:MAG: hypothetical protein QOE28_1539 [Solirubrobacteraceae bacterium]|nr:hypothetical protein [Solirubrobacteraceae bacterium]